MRTSGKARIRLSQLAETLARLATEAAHDGKAAANVGDFDRAIAAMAEGAAYIIASRAVRAARDRLINLDELSAELAYREGEQVAASAGPTGRGAAAAYAVARKALADVAGCGS